MTSEAHAADHGTGAVARGARGMPRGAGLKARQQRTPAQLLELIRDLGGVTRGDLSQRSGLSRSAVAHAVTVLLAGRLIVEQAPDDSRAGQRGRPAMLLGAARPAGYVIGIDVGPAHVAAALTDTSGHVIAEGRWPAQAGRDAGAALDASAQLVRSLLDRACVPATQVLAMAAALPGPPGPGGTAWRTTAAPSRWAGQPPGQELAAHFGRPVHLLNDVDAAALGEVQCGAARGRRDFLYVKASYQLTARLVLDGQIYRGAARMAGEIGHISLPGRRERCRCGGRGCLETVVSVGPLAGRLARIGVLPGPGGAAWPPARLCGSDAARHEITKAGRILGRALANLCICLNPEAVILGGEIGATGGSFATGFRESIGRYARQAAVDVCSAGLGTRSELMGAVALAVRHAVTPG